MMEDSRQNNLFFYKGKKVFITGHTGFKGAWLCCILHYMGATVSGYALFPEKGCLYEQIHGDSLINSHIGHLEDFEQLRETIHAVRPEIVIHLAAFGFINECYNNPRRAYSSNVMGTVNLLEAIRQCDSIKSVVIVSTDKVYLNKGDGAAYSEDDTLNGNTPYSCSKTCMEYIVEDYYSTYFAAKNIGIGVVRASNVLAGGDHIQTRLIPSILNSIDEHKAIEIRNPNQTRPWQSVLDALDGYLTVARYLYLYPKEYSGAWNIGPMRQGIKSVKWIVDKMTAYFDGAEMKKSDKFEVTESETLGLNIEKAITRLDWIPKFTIDRVVELVVDFYFGQKNGISAFKLCQDQIEEYYTRRK